MRADTSSPREIDIDFDELKNVMMNREPRRKKFLKSTRCTILVIIGLLRKIGVIALLATSYTIAVTATTAITTTSSSTPSTAIISRYQIITQLNDPIVAIYNASEGNICYNSVAGEGIGNYAPGQGPTACIDFSNTTYLNYGNVGYNPGGMTNTAGVGTGVYTTPQVSASIVRSIQFQAGNDSADRDPLSITLEGSNSTGTNLYSGSAWTLLYTGPTGLAPFNVTRLAWGDLRNFKNTQSFTSYRMIVTAQRGVSYGTEFAEMHLYGIV